MSDDWGNSDDKGWGDSGSDWAQPTSNARPEAKQKPKDNSNDDGWGGGGSDWGQTSSSKRSEYKDKPKVNSNDNGWGGGGGGSDWGQTSSSKRSEYKEKPKVNADDDGWGCDGSDWGQTSSSKRSEYKDKPKVNSSDNGWGGGGSDWGQAPSNSRQENNNKPRGNSNNSDWGNSGSDWGQGSNSDTQSDFKRKRPFDNSNEERKPFVKRNRFNDDNNQDTANDADPEKPAPYKPEELNLKEETELHSVGAGEDFHKYQDQKVTCLPNGLVIPVKKFDEIVRSKLILSNIKYNNMTPIQKWAMPAIMDGHDLIACAQTGSGKTAAFLLPILQTLLEMDLDSSDSSNPDCQNPYCLIISPTRELANQINTHASILSNDSIIKCHVIYGQIATGFLKAKLQTGCHILVATPGRLKDFVERGWIGFKNIRYIVLDEGDRLVDEGFTNDIKGFFSHNTMPPKEKRQTLFFSATFNDQTQVKAKEYLKEDFVFLTVGKIGAANESIKQEIIRVSRNEKKRELKKILEQVPENDKTIVFTQTKSLADILAGFFNSLKLSATSIHGDRHQSQREQAIKAFKRGEKRFLISSPVGNRGLDLPKVALVINFDLPPNIDEYVHRIGRTGRAGHTGRAISFYDEERDYELLPSLIETLKEAKQDIPDWMTGQETEAAPQQQSTGDDWNAPTNDGQTASTEECW